MFALLYGHEGLQCNSVISKNKVWDVPGMHNVAQIRLALVWSWLTRIEVRLVIWLSFWCWSVDFIGFQTIT